MSAALDRKLIEAIGGGCASVPDLRRATGATGSAVIAALRRLRWRGQVEEKRIALKGVTAEQFAAPAEVPAKPERSLPSARGKRVIGVREPAASPAPPAPRVPVAHDAVAIMAREIAPDLADGIRMIQRQWPLLWGEVIDLARARGERPGEKLVSVLQAGLAALRGETKV